MAAGVAMGALLGRSTSIHTSYTSSLAHSPLPSIFWSNFDLSTPALAAEWVIYGGRQNIASRTLRVTLFSENDLRRQAH